ncbi:hypothetical protein ASPSYDRAFT_93021 [Aspergillus sydowii CBS 593.65]|uniref:CorA-like transporter domain-containing protein n=1 Tax=Aspergillus sydowii CBS 593.65 TaxID=1036612 RepID=A0A1L9T6B7_9EURO|nr:uncharacterized protein ASPSYDRAFT_93021 [Aspergillus sydowii CBS 593.65]OJJ54992.1 hypothetical protein ASPSYDRAFT_93021 [Aspergillus sydowii CBS 593.65]
MELDTLPILTRPYGPAAQDAPDNAPSIANSPDLYSLIPYTEDFQARAESRICFNPVESASRVTWIDVDAGEQVTTRTLSSLAELRGCRNLHVPQENGLRILSVNQPNSWKPLNITGDMFREIVDIAGASSDLLELPLSFFKKTIALEEGFSSGPVVRHNADSIEIIYIMKYAFEKSAQEKEKDPWVLRQTGVYQKYELATKNSTWVLLHPTANCRFQSRLESFLQSPSQRDCLHGNPLLVHNILFGSFISAWRDYIKHLEGRMLPIANTTVAAEINKALRVNHESLTAIRGIENRCLVLQPIFRSLEKSFDVLHQANATLSDSGVTEQQELQAMKQLLNNYSAAINSYGQAAWSLQARASRIAAHITDTLSFQDAYVAKRQTAFMVRDSTTVRVITVVTLIYLPSTFMATLLGMNGFFEMGDNHNVVVSPQFWIYIVCSVPLTAATLCYWWYFQKAKQRRERSAEALMV